MVIDSFSYRYGFNYLHPFVLSLPLRDMYLKEHPQIVVE